MHSLLSFSLFLVKRRGRDEGGEEVSVNKRRRDTGLKYVQPTVNAHEGANQ